MKALILEDDDLIGELLETVVAGLDLVKQIRGSDREVPIVMVSGRSDRESVLNAAHYGIDGYITKPFDVKRLHERLGKLLKVELGEFAVLKVQWHLPMGLRDLIGAVHFLPNDNTREDKLIMRAAGMMTAGQQNSEECRRLLRRIGMETEENKQE